MLGPTAGVRRGAGSTPGPLDPLLALMCQHRSELRCYNAPLPPNPTVPTPPLLVRASVGEGKKKKRVLKTRNPIIQHPPHLFLSCFPSSSPPPFSLAVFYDGVRCDTFCKIQVDVAYSGISSFEGAERDGEEGFDIAGSQHGQMESPKQIKGFKYLGAMPTMSNGDLYDPKYPIFRKACKQTMFTHHYNVMVGDIHIRMIS